MHLDFFSFGVYPELDRAAVFVFVGFVHSVPIVMTSSSLRMFIAVMTVALTVSLFGTGCDRGSARAVPPPQKPVALGPDEPTTALPPDFYKDFPLYPGARVEHVRRPKGAMREVLFDSDAPVERLIAFLRPSLERNGFDIISTLQMKVRRTWSCDFHKSGRQASVLLYPSDISPSRTTIDFIYEIPSRDRQTPALPEEKFDVIGPGEIAQQNSETKRN